MDPLRWSLCALLVLTIGRVHQHFGVLAALRPALLLVLFSAAYAIAHPRLVDVWRLRRYQPPRLIAGLLLLAILGAPFGLSLGGSARFILDVFSKVILLAFLLIVAIRNVHDLRRFTWAFVSGVGFLIFISVFVFEPAQAGGVMRLGDLYTYDANDLGLLLVVGFPLGLLLFQDARGAVRVALGLLLVGIGLSIALSGSRGAFVGLLGVGLMLLLWLRGVAIWKRLGAVAAVVFGMSVMAPTGYWDQMRTITEPTEDYNWYAPYGRKAIARRGLGYMMSHPLTGVGIDNFGRAEGTLSETASEFQVLGRGVRWTAPHNSYVQIGAEMGFPGLLLWCGLVFGGIVGPRRLRKRLPSAWMEGDREERFLWFATLYLPVAFGGFALTSVFLSFAYLDPLYVLAALLTGLYGSVEGRLARERCGPVDAAGKGVRRYGSWWSLRRSSGRRAAGGRTRGSVRPG